MWGVGHHGGYAVPGEDGVDTTVMPGKLRWWGDSQPRTGGGGQPDSHTVHVEDVGSSRPSWWSCSAWRGWD